MLTNKKIENLTNKELGELFDKKLDHIKEAFNLKCFYVSKNESIELIGIVRFFRHYLDGINKQQYDYYIDLAFEYKDKSEIAIRQRNN